MEVPVRAGRGAIVRERRPEAGRARLAPPEPVEVANAELSVGTGEHDLGRLHLELAEAVRNRRRRRPRGVHGNRERESGDRGGKQDGQTIHEPGPTTSASVSSLKLVTAGF